MLRTKSLGTRIVTAILLATILQSCSARENAAPQEYSVYAVGDFENNLVISDGKYVGFWSDGYAINKNNPVEDLKAHGIKITKNESENGKCVNLGNTISFGVGAHDLQTCNGYIIKKVRSHDDFSLYFAFCPPETNGCPRGVFGKRPMYEYGLKHNSELLFFKFDPMAHDSKPYMFKMGKPFSLTE